MLLLSTIFFAGSETAPETVLPVRIAGIRQIAPSILRGTVDGKAPADFVLSFHLPKSYIPSTVLGEPADENGSRRTIQFGSWSLKLARVATRAATDRPNPFGVSGSLGRDALDRMAVGFDNDDVSVWLWPNGVGPEEARKWIESGPTLGLRRTGVRAGKLVRYPSGVIGFPATVAGQKIDMAIFPGTDVSLLDVPSLPNAAKAFIRRLKDAPPEDLGFYMTGPFESEAAGTFGIQARDVTGITLALVGAKETGLMKPNELYSRRVLVDVPSLTLYTEELDPDSIVAYRVSWSTGIAVSVERGKIVVRREERPAPWIAPYQGCEVLEIDGMPADDVLFTMRKGGKPAQELLAKLEREKVPGILMRVKGPEGIVVFDPLGRQLD